MDPVEHFDDTKLETIHESYEVSGNVDSHVIEKFGKSTVSDREHDNLQPDLEESMESTTSSQTTQRPRLGSVKPPSRGLHKNIPGSVSATATKSDEKKDRASIPALGPLVGHNIKSNESSPLSTDRRSEPSPRQLPGSNMSPSQVHRKGGFFKTDNLSPNSSFSLGSGGKLTAPPLGEIVTPVSKSTHSLRPSPSGIESDEKDKYMTSPSTHSPITSTSGVSPPRNLTPLGPAGLKPLSPAPRLTKLSPIRSTSQDPQVTSPNKEPVIVVGDELEHSIDFEHSTEHTAPSTEEIKLRAMEVKETKTEDSIISIVPDAVAQDDIDIHIDNDHTEKQEENKSQSQQEHDVSISTTQQSTDVGEIQWDEPEKEGFHQDHTDNSTQEHVSVQQQEAEKTVIADEKGVEEQSIQPLEPSTTPPKPTTEPSPAADRGESSDNTVTTTTITDRAEASENTITTTAPIATTTVTDRAEVGSATPSGSITATATSNEVDKTSSLSESTDVPTTITTTTNSGKVTPPSGSTVTTTVPTTTTDGGKAVPPGGSTVTTTVPNNTTEDQILAENEVTITEEKPSQGESQVAPKTTADVQATLSIEASSIATTVSASLPPPNTPVRRHVSGPEGHTGVGPLNISSIKHNQDEGKMSPRTPKRGATTPISRHGSHTSTSTPLLKGRSSSQLTHTNSTLTKHSPRDMGNSQSINSRDFGNSQSVAAQEYELSYNRIVSDLRTTLLQLDSDILNIKTVVRNIFKRLNVNEHGELTVQELKNFILSPELKLFSSHDPRAEKFSTMLMEQIDINNDGSISLLELETFLYPIIDINQQNENENNKEIGMVIDCTRTAVRYYVSSVAALGSDEAILAEFAKLAKSTLKRNTLDSKIVKKAFLNIKIPEFGRNLNKTEVEQLYNTIDCNDDGVVSALEFKHWLFPSYKKGNSDNISIYLRNLVIERFHRDIGNMFRSFCTGSDGVLYKGDFVTALKATDSAISRHEALGLANHIAGSDKAITMAHLQAAMGVSIGKTMLSGSGGEAQSVGFCESVDLDASTTGASFTSPRSKRRQRRENASSSKVVYNNDGQLTETQEETGGTPRTPRSRSRTQSGAGRSLLQQSEEDDQMALGVNPADALEENGGSDDDDYSVEHLSDASELSFDSAVIVQEGERGLRSRDGGSRQVLDRSDVAVRVDLQVPQPGENLVVVEPTQREKDLVWEMLYGTHTTPTKDSTAQDHKQSSGSVLPLADSSESHLLTTDTHPSPTVPRGESPRKTVGLEAPQLLALGYTQHTGRWRGFPYDNWSCCETSALECPNSHTSKHHRSTITSPGNSPNKSRMSIESLNSSLYHSPKSPPFIPAGRHVYSTTSITTGNVALNTSLELRHTQAPNLRDTGNREGFSTRRSSSSPTTRATATTTTTATTTAVTASARTNAMKTVKTTSQRSVKVNTSTAKPDVVKKRVSSRSSIGGSSIARPRSTVVRATPHPPTRTAASIPTRSSSAGNKDVSSIVVQGNSAPTTTTRQRRHSTQATTTTAIHTPPVQAPAAPPLCMPEPSTLEEKLSTVGSSSVQDSTTPTSSVLIQELPTTAPLPPDSSSSMKEDASKHNSSSNDSSSGSNQQQRPVPEYTQPVANPVVIINTVDSLPDRNTTATSAAVTSSPLKMKFTINIPAKPSQHEHEVTLPPNTTELFERLYAPVPVVEAHQALMHSPSSTTKTSLYPAAPAPSDDCSITEVSTPAPLALRATQELQSILSLDTTGLQYTSPALEKVWPALCENVKGAAPGTSRLSGTDAHSTSAMHIPATIDTTDTTTEKDHDTIHTTPSHKATHSSIHRHHTEHTPINNNNISIQSPQSLVISGTSHPKYSLDPDLGYSTGFHIDPLDALFPAANKRSPCQQRSHSAPAAGRSHSNSDSFFPAKSAGSMKSTHTPRPRSASTVSKSSRASVSHSTSAVAVVPSAGSRRRRGTWVPSSPLHATSFYRSQVRNKRPQPQSSPTQKLYKHSPPPPAQYIHTSPSSSTTHYPRSTSPRSCRQELRAPRKIASIEAVHPRADQTKHQVTVNRSLRTPASQPTSSPYSTHLHSLAVPSIDSYGEYKSTDHRSRGYSNISGVSTLGPQSPLSPTYGDLPDSLNPDTSYYAALFAPPPPEPVVSIRMPGRMTGRVSHSVRTSNPSASTVGQNRHLSPPPAVTTVHNQKPTSPVLHHSSYSYPHHTHLPSSSPLYSIHAPPTTIPTSETYIPYTTVPTQPNCTTDISAWWQHIQSLKRQHETNAFVLELYRTQK